VSFVDLPPSLLSLAGVRPPAWMQGRAFLGQYRTPDPQYVYGFRGRMDERYDLTRVVRDQRYIYLRNYMPHRPYGQHVAYLFQTPTTIAWKRMFDQNLLPPAQAAFFLPKPTEELYDLQDDPYETRNLAGSPAHAAALKRLRDALSAHLKEIRDVGFMPEYELQRAGAATPYERGHDPKQYDFDRVSGAAQQASDRAVIFDSIRPGLSDPNPIVRYWAAMGMVIRGPEAVTATSAELTRLLSDPEPGPRIVAAEALGRFGTPQDRERAIEVLLTDGAGPVFVAQLALYSLNQIERLPQAVLDRVAALPPVAAGRAAGAARGAGGGQAAGRGRGRGAANPAGGQAGEPAAGGAVAVGGPQGAPAAGAGAAAAAGRGAGAAEGAAGGNRGDQRANLKAAIAGDVR
jgi:uncharacterized sulfatase